MWLAEAPLSEGAAPDGKAATEPFAQRRAAAADKVAIA
jgi:hypothetical protein